MKTKKILASTLGVILATGALSAMAGKADRENLTQCKAELSALYGSNTIMRLRSVKRGETDTQMRLMVTPRDAGNRVVVCTVDREGSIQLADREGIALVPAVVSESLSKAH